ncbi:hypothetical protein PoB_003833400 [Plakobranchus ocellatus]|uniref:Uncharacterized protein n=1 Tax=Plakobranchus ocellatus TaxID=259542 RepID=A0AAV4AZL2_9GAST|nr:hypothetical protein PoB_003833400 [Plakobranchus ocellatus]
MAEEGTRSEEMDDICRGLHPAVDGKASKLEPATEVFLQIQGGLANDCATGTPCESTKENGGTFQQARKAVVVELHKTISTQTFASAVKSQLRTKPAALPKDGGRSAPSAPPKGKKAQRDSPAPSPQGAAEADVPAKRRAEKSKRQEVPR